jgi:23S rRNA (adenine2503-C2)-methyltransferase
VKVNLIPFNPDPEYLPALVPPDEERIDAFAGVLAASHLNVTVRWSRGRDISGACGQLRGRADRGDATSSRVVPLHGG